MSGAAQLRKLLLDPAQAREMRAHGHTDAAVLIPLYGWPEHPGVVLTERRGDLRRHAGEISFPGGRQDPEDADLAATALREAHEEIGLAADAVEIAGALPPVSTFVTNYRVHSFVGLIDVGLSFEPSPDEVESVLLFPIEALRKGFDRRRVMRRGMAIRTETYLVEEHMIWGATARIIGHLLERLADPETEENP